MADQTTLTNWILANQAELDLRVKECVWIREIFPGWHDLDIAISVQGERFRGRGCDESADVALSKAFCEAIERSICHTNGFSSVGVAGHTNSEAAKENARLEYIERRTLFEYFTEGWKLPELRLDPKIQGRYDSRGIKISLYKLNADPANVALAIASGLESPTPFGGILGLGAHQNGAVAARKAVLECLQGVEAFLNHPSPSLSHEEFLALESPTALDRQSLFRDYAYFMNSMGTLSGEPSGVDWNTEGAFEALKPEAPVLLSCPLKFFRFVPVDKTDIALEFVG